MNNDGGIDILVTNNNGPARLLLNTAPERGHWILVKLEGVRSNRSGYGSVVELIRKDGTSVTALGQGRWQLPGGQRSPSPLRVGYDRPKWTASRSAGRRAAVSRGTRLRWTGL